MSIPADTLTGVRPFAIVPFLSTTSPGYHVGGPGTRAQRAPGVPSLRRRAARPAQTHGAYPLPGSPLCRGGGRCSVGGTNELGAVLARGAIMAAASRSEPVTTLPTPLTPLVGREREVAAV